MSRTQGQPLAKDDIGRIRMLLEDSDLPMSMIAEQMDCTRASITRINGEFECRSGNGPRSNWTTEGQGFTSHRDIKR